MAKKKTGFFERKWGERSFPEKAGIVVGSVVLAKILISNRHKIKAFFSPGLQSYLHKPGEQGLIYDPRPLVDEIATETIGYNYSYSPELVNQLTDLTKEELMVAYEYWNQKYRGTAGGSLTKTLEGEWASALPWSESYYQPAIDWLKSNGLY